MRPTFDSRRIRQARLMLLSGCCFLSFVALASAGQVTTASVVGQVRDEGGGALPGVTVTATSPALQVPSVSDVTNERGEYRLTTLPIGNYQLLFTLPGFQDSRQDNVRLTVGLVATLDAVLKIGGLSETVTVASDMPIVDVTSTAASTRLTRETLELTPTSRNGLISLLAQVPGVRSNLDVGGGNVGDVPAFRVFGLTGDPWTTVEGVFTTDPRVGGNYFDYGSVEEAQVQTTSTGPDVAARGPAITLVVKSGGNDFHGRASYSTMSPQLQAHNIDEKLRGFGISEGGRLLERTDHGVELGGRILRDRLWFFGSSRYRRQNNETIGSFKPDGSPGNDYKGEVITDEKFTSQLNPANRIIGYYHWQQKRDSRGGTQFEPWESRRNREPPIRTTIGKAEWQATYGNKLVTSFQFARWWWMGARNIASMNPPTITDYAGFAPASMDIATLQVRGTPEDAGNINSPSRYHTKGTLSWYLPNLFAGNHELKAGFDYMPYTAGSAYILRGKAGEYRLYFNNGLADQIDIYNNPVEPRSAAITSGIYLNDTWTMARRLTLHLGARYGRENGLIPKQCREAGPFALAGCIDKIQFKIWNSISPRLYASYALWGGKSVVRGGWGRFAQARTVDEIIPAHPFAAIASRYRWRDLNGNRDYDAGEVDLNPNGPDFLNSTVRDTATEVTEFVDNPDEKQPKVDQFSLSYEQQIANFSVRLSGVYVRTFNEQRRLNLLRPYDSYNIAITRPDPGPDGRVGTSDDPGTSLTYWEYPATLAGRQSQRSMLVNDPRSNEKHSTIETAVTKRISNRWQFLASYSATKNDTLVPHIVSGYRAPVSLDPNSEYNKGDQFWEWLGRMSGTFTFPGQVTFSANFDHRSGGALARQVLVSGGQQIPSLVVNVEPIGSLRLPHTNILDFRVQKVLSLVRAQNVSLAVNIYNATNANTVTAMTVRSGPNYLRPSAIVRPTGIDLSVSYSF